MQFQSSETVESDTISTNGNNNINVNNANIRLQKVLSDKKTAQILHLMSRLLVLVIVTDLFTIILICTVVIRLLSDNFGAFPSTIFYFSFAFDTYFNVFAIFAQFDAGRWFYLKFCHWCHHKILEKQHDRLKQPFNTT